jgi:hypothetical protein
MDVLMRSEETVHAIETSLASVEAGARARPRRARCEPEAIERKFEAWQKRADLVREMETARGG